MDDNNVVGQNIKKYRLKHNITLKELAEAVGVRESTAQRYESGNIKSIPYEKIVAIAEYLKCMPTDLMGWSEDGVYLKYDSREHELLELFGDLSDTDKDLILNMARSLTKKSTQ